MVHLLFFSPAVVGNGVIETPLEQFEIAVAEAGLKAALQLVLALGPGVEAGQLMLDTVFNTLVIAGTRSAEIPVAVRSPIDILLGLKAEDSYCG
jgi:hypothetical protein